MRFIISFLLYVVHTREQPVPSDLSVEPTAVGVQRKPNEDRLAHNVVFGHEAPVTGVGRVVAVVAHHPIVVHLEGLLVRFLSVDVNLAVLHVQLIAFVSMDATFVDGQVV